MFVIKHLRLYEDTIVKKLRIFIIAEFRKKFNNTIFSGN